MKIDLSLVQPPLRLISVDWTGSRNAEPENRSGTKSPLDIDIEPLASIPEPQESVRAVAQPRGLVRRFRVMGGRMRLPWKLAESEQQIYDVNKGGYLEYDAARLDATRFFRNPVY